MTAAYSRLPFVWGAAGTTGADHKSDGFPSQDWHDVQVLHTDDGMSWMIAVAADGAGSAVSGGVGAMLATFHVCNAIVGAIEAELTSDLATMLKTAVTYARAQLQGWATASDQPFGDYATTLSVAVSNGTRHAFAQIGDGAIVTGPEWKTVLAPQNGEYINETTFLTCDRWWSALDVKVVTGTIRNVVIMTDGIHPLAVEAYTHRPHAPFFDWVTEGLDVAGDEHSERLRLFLGSDQVTGKSSDDTTLIAISIAPPELPW